MSINNIALKAARAAYEYADRPDLSKILIEDLEEAAAAADAGGDTILAADMRRAAAAAAPRQRGEVAIVAAVEALLRLQQGL